MKIELTVHLGTLLTHTVHRYAHFSLSQIIINTGVKKKTSLPVWRGVQVVKGDTTSSTSGQNMDLPVREVQVHVLPLSQSESTRAAQCKQIKADEGVSIQWLQQNGAPSSQWERLSHSCYVKCSLAVIPLVTGYSSPVCLQDRRRRGGPSSGPFIPTKICSHSTE